MQIINLLKFANMKYINKTSILFLLVILMGIGLTSCTNENPVVLNVKPTAQFIKQYTDFYNTESLILDSAKIGYKKGYFNPSQQANYTKFYTAYLTDLRADSALLATPGVTMAQLVLINKSMAVSGFNFVSRLNVCDKQALADSITHAFTLLGPATMKFFGAVGTTGISAVGKVLPADYTNFNSVIAASQPARDSATYVVPQVNKAIANIIAARTTYINAIIPSDVNLYKQKSKDYINSQLALCYKAIIGYGVYQYVPLVVNNYIKVLRPDSILADPNTTTTTIDVMAAGNKTLETPRPLFAPNLYSHTVINDSINSALTLYNAIPSGTTVGTVPLSAKITFNSSITSSTTIRDNPFSLDTDMTASIFNLSKARNVFVAAIKK